MVAAQCSPMSLVLRMGIDVGLEQGRISWQKAQGGLEGVGGAEKIVQPFEFAGLSLEVKQESFSPLLGALFPHLRSLHSS